MSTSIDRQLEEFILKYDFTIPDRELKELETTDVTWRDGKPDYRGVDLAYFKGKSKNHPVGSLEITVENLVKKWEMEVTHFMNAEDLRCENR